MIGQFDKLPLGIYYIYWREGGRSLASVGQCYDGTRWMAPINWIRLTSDSEESRDLWEMVKSAELLQTC